MSEYQKIKARAMEVQRQKEEAMRREMKRQEEREKELAKAEEERRKNREAAAKEARRLELMRANEALVRKQRAEEARRTGTASNLNVGDEWNPFAEDEVRPAAPPVLPRSNGAKPIPKPRPTTHGNGSGTASPRAPRVGPSSSTSKGAKPNKDKASPPPLGRKERAAQLFAQKTKRAAKATESIFSVRSLVEGRRDSPAGSSRASPLPGPVKTDLQRGRRGALGSGGSSSKVGEMRKLCPDRATRDRRTIDEIQKDLKAARRGDGDGKGKGKEGDHIWGRDDHDARAGPPSRSGNKGGTTRGHSPGKSHGGSSGSTTVKLPDPRPKAKPPPVPSTARPSRPPPAPTTAAPQSTLKRRRPSYASSASTTPSTSSSTSPPPPSSRRPRGDDVHLRDDPASISATIQALFRRPDRPPPKPVRYSDDEDDDEGGSDMEAGLSDVEAEERRAAMIARREDEAEERRERERRLAKMARLGKGGRA